MPLPANIPKRGLSEEEGAEYCGVSVNTLRRHGPKPTKIGDRNVYDRRLLDLWFDELAGLALGKSNGADLTSEEQLLEAIDARKAALRGAPD